MKFIFLVGLPGAGKTYYGKQIDGLFLDDICQTCGIGRLKEGFIQQTVIVADPSLCLPFNRKCAELIVNQYHPGCEIEWVFWDNNFEQCWVNVEQREDGRKISKYGIKELSKKYAIPIGVNTREVHVKQDELSMVEKL